MKVETSTSLIPVIDVNSYGDYVYDDFWFNRESIRECILDCAPDFIRERITDYVPSAVLSDFDVQMPREYNFYGDRVDFTLEIPDDEFQRMYDDALTNPEFEKWLKRYSSYSGFISFQADNIEKFQNQDLLYTVSQLVSYACRDCIEEYENDIDYSYEEAISEWAWNNVPPCEDHLDNGYSIGSDYGYSFTVWDDKTDTQIAEFQVSGDTTKDYWDAYDKAYAYAVELGGDPYAN